jgi:hypothetical protein
MRTSVEILLERTALPCARFTLRPAICVLLGIVLLFSLSRANIAAEEASSSSAPAIASEALDRAIGETIQHRKYSWRVPREGIVPDESGEKGVLANFFDQVGRMIRNAIKGTAEWIGKVWRKIFGGRTRTAPPAGGSDTGWAALLEILLYVLVAAVLCAIGVLVYRLWRNRRLKPDLVETEAIQPVPDLADESVGADQLPEDGWLRLAQELLARGEFRLALRAFYLSSLAHLAERNLISLARFKSNHDYERELDRRAHAIPNLRQLFGENVNAFDRVWYGTHEATGELVTQFAANVARIKSGA